MSDEPTVNRVGKPYVFRTPTKEEMLALGFGRTDDGENATDDREHDPPLYHHSERSVNPAETSKPSVVGVMESNPDTSGADDG